MSDKCQNLCNQRKESFLRIKSSREKGHLGCQLSSQSKLPVQDKFQLSRGKKMRMSRPRMCTYPGQHILVGDQTFEKIQGGQNYLSRTSFDVSKQSQAMSQIKTVYLSRTTQYGSRDEKSLSVKLPIQDKFQLTRIGSGSDNRGVYLSRTTHP